MVSIWTPDVQKDVSNTGSDRLREKLLFPFDKTKVPVVNICCFCQCSIPSPWLDNVPLISGGSTHPHHVPFGGLIKLWIKVQRGTLALLISTLTFQDQSDRSPRNLAQGQNTVRAESFDYNSPKRFVLVSSCHCPASLWRSDCASIS